MTLCSWWFVGISALVGFVQTGVLRRPLKFAVLFLFVGKLDLKDTGFGGHFDFFSDFFFNNPTTTTATTLDISRHSMSRVPGFRWKKESEGHFGGYFRISNSSEEL